MALNSRAGNMGMNQGGVYNAPQFNFHGGPIQSPGGNNNPPQYYDKFIHPGEFQTNPMYNYGPAPNQGFHRQMNNSNAHSFNRNQFMPILPNDIGSPYDGTRHGQQPFNPHLQQTGFT
jgi:hypothetical protein